MSAGGLSYHGVIGNKAKITLPSVDTWGTNMNILRDPPKMIMTRKIDKVGETSSITQMQENSADRACEAINTYARGVNPFVAVSYNNYGNNGGQRVNGFSSCSTPGQQSRKPYAIGPNSSFRPPVQPPQSLLPLSRQPRIWTNAFTNASFPNYARKAKCFSKDDCLKEVVQNPIRPKVYPTATIKIETPIKENFQVKHVIQNPIQISGNSGVRTLDRSSQHNVDPTKQIRDPLHVDAITQKSSSLRKDNFTIDTSKFTQDPLTGEIYANVNVNKHVNNSEFDTSPYLQDQSHYSTQANVSQNIQLLPLEDIMNVDVRVKNNINVDYTTPYKGFEKAEYIHDDVSLSRKMPNHSFEANKSENKFIRNVDPYQQQLRQNRPVTSGFTNNKANNYVDNVSSKSYNLKPTLSYSQYQGRAGMPSYNTDHHANSHYIDQNKQSINRNISNLQGSRVNR